MSQGKPQDRSRFHLRWATAIALIAWVLSFTVGYAVPVLLTGPGSVLPQAAATPKPGDPGGNHSKPGDNKKKKKDDDNNTSQKKPSSNDNKSSNEEPEQSGSEFGDQTNANNGWEQDGDGRSVDVRVSRDDEVASTPRQPPRTMDPNYPSTAADSDEAQAQSDQPYSLIPPKRELAEDVTKDYKSLRNLTPGETLRDQVQRAAQDGEIIYDRNPFNDEVETTRPPHADHLVPVRRLYDIPGFADLDSETKKSIANSPENIIATTPGENLSRKERTYAEYVGRGDGTPLDPAHREELRLLENRVYPGLVEKVNQAWAEKFPGRAMPSPDGPVQFTNGPVDLPAQPPPLEIPLPNNRPEVAVVTGPPDMPIVQVTELPSLPPTVEVPGQVPPVIDYPLPPARPPVPPVIGNQPPLVVGTPTAPDVPAIPPAIGNPAVPPIGTPVDPLQVLFPSAPAPSAAPPPATILGAVRPTPVAPVTPEPIEITRLPSIPDVARALVRAPVGIVPFVFVMPPGLGCQMNPASCAQVVA